MRFQGPCSSFFKTLCLWMFSPLCWYNKGLRCGEAVKIPPLSVMVLVKVMIMLKVVLAILVLMLLVQGCGAHWPMAGQRADGPAPLIDRELFFDDPEYAGARISPDGEFISFRRQLDGVMNVWVKRRGVGMDEAWPVTADKSRPITTYFWSQDSKYILYIQDTGGDENFHIYAVDPAAEPEAGALTPRARNLTPKDGVRARIYSVPRDTPDYIVVGLNDRDPRLHDVYRLNIHTGDKELLALNDANIAAWHVDRDGELRLATRQTADGGAEILKIHDEDRFESIYEVNHEESVGVSLFRKDGHRFYMTTNRGADLTSLAIFDLETGEKEILASDPEGEVDFGGAIYSYKNDEMLAYTYFGDYPRVYPQQEQFAADYEYLKGELGDIRIDIASQTHEEDIWLVAASKDTDPGSVYVFERENRELRLLYRSRPELDPGHLAEMQAIRYTARDGLEIPAYLTLPQGREPKNLPVVVNPHGGPWVRDYWGYSPAAQFLANRGYAVLQINYRGSSGFGKEFLNAGNQEWGTGYMQHDITDGVQHLIAEGIADPDRVGIYGGSYGGYATLAGLAFTPELYAAGVSFVGPSNIITLLDSVPPYWEPVIKRFHRRVGDPEDPDDRRRLKEQSPLYAAENIVAPLLVVQGANDPRVIQRESDQIVAALRDLGRPVEYIVAPDEGHGFRRRENRLAYIYAMERFFADHLGGRYQEQLAEPIRRRLEEITMDVDRVSK